MLMQTTHTWAIPTDALQHAVDKGIPHKLLQTLLPRIENKMVALMDQHQWEEVEYMLGDNDQNWIISSDVYTRAVKNGIPSALMRRLLKRTIVLHLVTFSSYQIIRAALLSFPDPAYIDIVLDDPRFFHELTYELLREEDTVYDSYPHMLVHLRKAFKRHGIVEGGHL